MEERSEAASGTPKLNTQRSLLVSTWTTMATLHSHGGDRLSALPDSVLVRVLSHLVSDEAVRSSALSRRWRDVYEAVPVVNLVDPKKGDRYSCGGFFRGCFDHQVTSAILAKGMTTPIRIFHLSVLQPPYDLLDQWIGTVVTSGVEDLDVELRYQYANMRTLCPFASVDSDENATEGYTKTHRQIFGCTMLRRLRLKNWTLDLSRDVAIESLETLCLVRITDPTDGLLQQLVSSCPRLVHLTLEECPSVKEISVPSPRLRSFTIICCHNASSVELRTTCLQSLHYKGALPPRRSSSFLTVANYQQIKAVTVEICENLCSKGSGEVVPLTALIRHCCKLTYLHLSLHPSIAYYSSMFTSVLRDLHSLTHLSLQGCLPTDHAVRSVSALLLNTRNLQVLSLFPLEETASDAESDIDPDDGSDNDADALSYTERDIESDTEPNDSAKPTESAINNGAKDSSRIPESLWRLYVRCLDRSVRRINIENYRGRPLEKMLARFLLSRAAALEEFSVTLAAGLYQQKDEIGKELAFWRRNRYTIVTCKLRKKK
jgi:hypothetical protein